MAISKEELSELVEKLDNYKGRHTELITVYIPEGYDCNAVQRQLEAEKSTAKNIKSTATRKNVTDALDKIVRELKGYKQTPTNGMAIFCGNISPVEGQTDLQIWAIEPPKGVRVRMYRCDKDFVLDPLKLMLEVSEVFGLVVMDRKEATIGLLEGKKVEVLQKLSSGVPSKVKAGGQSAQRFHRITEGLTKEFYKRIAEEMKSSFFENPKLKGILIGGPVPTKDEFVEGEYLLTPLQEKIIGMRDLGNTDESGLKDLVEISQDVLAEQEIIREKKILEKFFTTLGENPEMARYKIEEVKKALEYGAAERVLISSNNDKKTIEEIKKLAELISAEIHIISTETPEGEQFKNLSGIGAILRYKI